MSDQNNEPRRKMKSSQTYVDELKQYGITDEIGYINAAMQGYAQQWIDLYQERLRLVAEPLEAEVERLNTQNQVMVEGAEIDAHSIHELQQENEKLKRINKELNRQVIGTDEDIYYCGECKQPMEIVRPGKHICNNSECKLNN